MKEILIAIVSAVALFPFVYLLIKLNAGDGGAHVEDDENTHTDEEGAKVLAILRRVYRDMNAQRFAGCGGWVPAAIEHGEGDPSVALMAVQMTLRDMYARPSELDVPGLPTRYKFGVLWEAEEELKKMMGAGE